MTKPQATHQYSLLHLTEHLSADYKGDPETLFTGVSSLETANKHQVSFLAKEKDLSRISNTASGAIIVPKNFSAKTTSALIYVENPYAAFARLSQLFSAVTDQEIGIHETALLGNNCQIAAAVSIAAGVIIGDGVTLGSGVVIGPGCVIGSGCSIGDATRLAARVTLYDRIVIGDSCLLHSGVVIGCDGFGFAPDNGQWIKIAHVGSVIIGHHVEIGANTTIDRGTMDDTVIEDGVILDNQIQIAHNVTIGENTAIAACVGVAGSAKIGKRCKISGAAVVLGHLELCDDVTITAMSLVTKSIKEPGVYSSGTPLQANRLWHRSNARYRQLDKLTQRVTDLEKQKK